MVSQTIRRRPERRRQAVAAHIVSASGVLLPTRSLPHAPRMSPTSLHGGNRLVVPGWLTRGEDKGEMPDAPADARADQPGINACHR
jgi:hypothetical protein